MTPERINELYAQFWRYSPSLDEGKECLDEIERLQAENARLREALEKIPYGSCMTSDGRACLCCSVAIKIATNALAERQEGCGDDG